MALVSPAIRAARYATHEMYIAYIRGDDIWSRASRFRPAFIASQRERLERRERVHQPFFDTLARVGQSTMSNMVRLFNSMSGVDAAVDDVVRNTMGQMRQMRQPMRQTASGLYVPEPSDDE